MSTIVHPAAARTEPAPPASPSRPVRVSNAEREETVARLHDALGEGRLDLAETEARVAAAYAATYRSELPALLADLPDGPGGAGLAQSGVPAWGAIWTAVVWRARIAVLGAGVAGEGSPTGEQRRLAAALTVFAAVWMTLFAFLCAALVGA
jgi:Domain of unknown function (DUF1707)